MAKKTTKIKPWTKEDVRTLKALAREKMAKGVKGTVPFMVIVGTVVGGGVEAPTEVTMSGR
jgi:hypothetical protein